MSPTSFVPCSDPKTIGFLDLPLEIRIFVYREVVLQPDTVELSHRRPLFECLQDDDTTAILSLNHQTRTEALDVFYSENTFRIVADEDNKDLLSKLPQADRLPIRRLELTHSVIASSLSNTMLYRPDVGNKTWMSVLSNLKSLRIIVVEPSRLPVHEEIVAREEGEEPNSMISLSEVKSFYSQLVSQSLESSSESMKHFENEAQNPAPRDDRNYPSPPHYTHFATVQAQLPPAFIVPKSSASSDSDMYQKYHHQQGGDPVPLLNVQLRLG